MNYDGLPIMTQSRHKPSPSPKYIIGAAAAGLSALIIILFFTGTLSVTFNPPSPAKSEYVEPLVTGFVNVGAASYEYLVFDAPADSSHPIVRGSFFAGDSDNIHVMILDGGGFAQWQAGLAPAKLYYSSSQTVAGDLEAGVPKGETLYLILDNTHEAASDKIITADIELSYVR